MYCRKCGKFIEYDGEFCKDCIATNNPFEEDKEIVYNIADKQEKRDIVFESAKTTENEIVGNASSNSDRVNKSRMFGFGKALTSLILAVVAISISEIASTLLFNAMLYLEDYEVADPIYAFWTDCIMVFVLAVIILGLSIPSIVLASKSIRAFIRVKHSGGVPPIVTLVLGIIGLALAVIAVLLVVGLFMNFNEALAVYSDKLW